MLCFVNKVEGGNPEYWSAPVGAVFGYKVVGVVKYEK